MEECIFNLFVLNDVYNNQNGLILDRSSQNTLGGNYIHNNVYGISLEGVQHVVFILNSIYNNTEDGIQLVDSCKNKLLKNEIYENGADGIHAVCSEENVVSESNIWNNSEYGVHILDSSKTNVLIYNVIRNCGSGGVYIYEGQNNMITGNVLMNNDEFDAKDNGGDNIWRNNFYSDYMGSDLNGDGFGDVPYVIHGQRGTISIDPGPLMIAPVDGGPPGGHEVLCQMIV